VFESQPLYTSVQYRVVFPLVELPHSAATAARRADTVLRTLAEVDLKYSENFEAEPELAAVEAALANDWQLFNAARTEVF